MIVLFEENERKFDSLGLGVLKDATKANVKEKRNGAFELTMEYPMTGQFFDKLKINRIICCKSNPFSTEQPFRISSITKPIKGIVTVEAVHVSYDANGFPVKPISASNLVDLLNKIQNGEEKTDESGIKKTIKYSLIDNPFSLWTNIQAAKTFKTSAPYNLRALLMGGDQSIVEVYNAELEFDKFQINILSKRGRDRGARIIYGSNMTDINNVSDNTKLYNGVYPYYHSESTSSETISSGEFRQAYIVGTKPFVDGWLSYSNNGEPFHPISSDPIQIATEGDYYQKVYCWNENYQKFEEKIYNEQILIIKDVLEPNWVSIDWTKFPVVTCKARKVGYFKKSTDEDWGNLKGVGDIVFEASILNSNVMENIMLCYSEVIPNTTESENQEVEEVIHVELDDPIIYVDTVETRLMKHNNILQLDLTSEFNEEPTQQQLRNKAEEYISKNKIGVSKDNIEVSFVDLSRTTESNKYENFDHIEIGDTVHIIYEGIGINTTLRVLSTDYNVLNDSYNSVELGDVESRMTEEVVQSGDNVSSLTNDVGYTDKTTVNELIAKKVTAEYIEAVDAKMSKATIKQLETERINCKGIIEASQFTLDTLVAKLLIAENASIAKTLEAGSVKVNGKITVNGGSILINGVDANQNETYFRVDNKGNLQANSVNIIGGDLNIGNGNFIVSNAGEMTAKMAYISGTIEALSGKIGGFDISENHLLAKNGANEIYIGPDKISLGETFQVTNAGEMTAEKGIIGNFNLENGHLNYENGSKYVDISHEAIKLGKNSNNDFNFKVDSEGNVIAKSISIEGGSMNIGNGSVSIASDGTMRANKLSILNGSNLCDFTIDNTSIYKGTTGTSGSIRISTGYDAESGLIEGCDQFARWMITAGHNFGVTSDGKIYASEGKLGGLSMSGGILKSADENASLPYVIINTITGVFSSKETRFRDCVPTACMINYTPIDNTRYRIPSSRVLNSTHLSALANSSGLAFGIYEYASDMQTGTDLYKGFHRIYPHELTGFHQVSMTDAHKTWMKNKNYDCQGACLKMALWISDFSFTNTSAHYEDIPTSAHGFTEVLAVFITQKNLGSNETGTWDAYHNNNLSYAITNKNQIRILRSSNNQVTDGYAALIIGWTKDPSQ